MKKTEMIEDIATHALITKVQARLAIERVVQVIQDGLKKEGRFPMANLGTFTVTKRAARVGRNPSTGEKLKIKASKRVGFRAAASLKAVAQKAKV